MKNRKVKGFTLIELIVVIAIIAVLAAILIPNLLGWVAKSSLRTANTNAKAVATNAASVIADYEITGVYVPGGDVYSAGGTGSTFPKAEFTKKIADLAGFGKDNKWGFSLDAKGKIEYAYWKKTDKSPYVGTYPVEATDKNAKTDSGKEAGTPAPGGGGDNSEG